MDALVRHPARKLADFFGRLWFLVFMLCFLSFWYLYNLFAPAPFDPPPFGYLQGIMTGVMSMIDVMILVASQQTQKIVDKQTAYIITMMENSLTTMQALQQMGDREEERDKELMQLIKDLQND